MFDGLMDFLNRYSSISADEFKELIKRLEIRDYDKKTCLTKTGETEQYLYFVVKGLTRKFFYKGKTEVITHIVKEGGIIGSAASFFSGTPSRYMVETIEPTTALSVSRQNLEELYSSSNKWERIGRMMITQFFLVQEYRLLDNIRYTTRERFLHFMEENPDLLLRVPQKQLAAYLNIKPETFSRLKHLTLKKTRKHPFNQ
jgi:CRP-like cAMP-binding protein